MILQTQFKIDDFMGKQKEIGWTKDNIRVSADNEKPKTFNYCQERADEILRERVRAMDDHEKAVVYEELKRVMQTSIHYY